MLAGYDGLAPPFGGSGYFPVHRSMGTLVTPVATPVATPMLPCRAPQPQVVSQSPAVPMRPIRRMSAPVLVPPVQRPMGGSLVLPAAAGGMRNDSVPGPPIPVYAPNQQVQRVQYVMANRDAEGEALQESFQLGDEASNIYGTWRAPWEPTAWEPPEIPEEPEPEVPDNQVLVDMAPEVASPAWKEQQFLALLDSLETRVDLMSQMQETRNVLSQMPTSPTRSLRSLHSSPKKSSPLGGSDVLDLSQKVASWPQPGPIFCELADWVAPRLVLPFNRELCGVNLQLSQDGYRAERTRGCRQSVAIGSAPLQITQDGRYFEITMEETVPGWVGGLGIGVAQQPMQSMSHCAKRLPDKAWRIPKTSVVGYWGCLFLNGSEYRTSWHSDTLRVGSKVGFLVTNTGDLLLFVDGEAMVHIERAISQEDLLEPMHPIVDVFAATRVVSLSPSASPPPRPWVVTPTQAL